MMKIEQFLAKYGLLAENIDANELIGVFMAEMESGLAGRTVRWP